MTVHIERVGEPDAHIRAILLHGAGGNAAALWPFAALAAECGAEVVVPDLPGYGRTRVPHPGAVRYTDWVDLACALTTAEKGADTRPLWLVGASMGGMLAYEAATRTGLADRVVATCLLDPRDPAVRKGVARTPWLGAIARPLLRLAAGPLANVRLPIRWLVNMNAMSNQPDLADLVLRDKRGGGNRVPLGFLLSYLRSAPAVEPETVTEPEFLLAHPAADRWTPVELSARFFNRIAAPKKLVLLEGAGHFPIEEPGIGQLVDVLAEG
ncbi:MAG: alpha/beta hydrolase [Pseudonocardiaceae bacterium]